ncbi:MAG: hypothetical protein DRP63_01500 [Planctomycetota bacterium]|nr:MAG: hypothetical protein DRP63_01500 [Planctomycetota bacterium]
MVRRGPAPGSRDWLRRRGGEQRRDRGARHRRGREQPDPKPFVWIPTSTQKSPQRQENFPQHDMFVEGLITAQFELKFTVLSDYLFVGSGGWEVTKDGRAYRTFCRRGDDICIPATSIKGAVRAVYEAITNSCVSQTSWFGLPPSYSARRCRERLCPACRLFGTTGYAARIRFSDALPLRKTEPKIVQIFDLFPPRNEQGRKFYAHGKASVVDGPPQRNHHFVEAVVGNTEFRARVTVFNAEYAELAALFVSMGLLGVNGRRIKVKIGGAKPRCFGTVRFELLDGKDWEGRTIQKEALFAELRNAFSLVDMEAFGRLADAAYRLPNCPRRLY